MFVSASNVSYGIGQRIENCRLIRGHTQIGLASKIGLTYQEVNSYENGYTPIPIGVLYVIARVLSVNAVDLLPKPITVREHKDEDEEILYLTKIYENQKLGKIVPSLVRFVHISEKINQEEARLEVAKNLVKEGVLVDAIKGISRFVYSPLKVELPEIPENGSDHSDTIRNPSNQYTNQFSSEVCVSNNVGLAFFLLQSFLDKKYPLPNLCSVTPKEALADTLNIVGEFEKTLEKTAKQSGVSVKGFDFFKVYLDIAGHVRNERYSQIPNTLYLITKEACPKNKKFLSILKGNIEKMFNEQQIVNSGYQPNYIADSKPRSYLSNTTVDKQLQRSYHAISS